MVKKIQQTRFPPVKKLEFKIKNYAFVDLLDEKSAITDRSLIYEMNHICFDLDHPVDFLFMEYLLQNNKLDFNL